MTYDFKRLEESLWFIATTLGFELAQYATTFDLNTVTDWHSWVRSAIGGVIRAVGGAVLSWRASH